MTETRTSQDFQIRVKDPASEASFSTVGPENSRIIREVAAGEDHTLIRGCPGSGRTTVALNVARAIYESGQTSLMVIAPDRQRVDLLQSYAENTLPGIVRPVRTPIALAFHFTSRWAIERANPIPKPELLTGANEDVLVRQTVDLVEWPPEFGPETIHMAEFRVQVRNLIARAREAGWSGSDLAQKGAETGIDIWVSVGHLMQHWEERNRQREQAAAQAQTLEGPHYDSIELQKKAAELILNWDAQAEAQGVSAPLDAPKVVIVDDLQDCTTATLKMLEALAKVGSRIIATANPDIAVATYRGGEPHLDGRFAASLKPKIVELGPTYRGNQAMREVVKTVTSRITVQDPGARREMGAHDPDESGAGLSVKVYGSKMQEAVGIAHLVEKYQYGYGPGIHGRVDLEDQAVIVRNSADIRRIRFGLMRNGIETTIRKRAINYASDPVTSVFLKLLTEAAEEPEQIELYDAVLRSPIINLNAVDIRKITDLYRANVDASVVSAYTIAKRLADDSDPEIGVLKQAIQKNYLTDSARIMVRAYELVKTGQENLPEEPRVALWHLWKLADVQETWVRQALRPGVESEIFDDRLDAIVSLFRSADVWEQGRPGDNAEAFANELLGQTLPTDTLAATGMRPKGVQILTVNDAVGKSWKVVYVVGIQDGVWPNLTLRNRITRAGEVTSIANGKVTASQLRDEVTATDPSRVGESFRQARRAKIVEEYRMLAAAVSRAESALHLSAVESDEESPSTILFALATTVGTELTDDGRVPVSKVSPGIGTRPLVAQLRQRAAQTDDQDLRDAYAKLLAIMSTEGINRANPNYWNGVDGYGLTEDSKPKTDKVWLSPSQVETLINCPAQWFLSRHGGSIPFGEAINTGLLVHAIAEEYPLATEHELTQALEEVWPEEKYPRDTAFGRREFEKVQKLMQGLAFYNQATVLSDKEDTPVVEVEKPIAAELKIEDQQFVISGRIDRMERTSDGMIVADIKTGTSVLPTPKSDTKNNLQLACYQFALNALGETPSGARLIALAKTGKTGTGVLGYDQPGLFDGKNSADEKTVELRAELEALLAEASRRAKATTFPATPGDHCRFCKVKNMCPVQDEGSRTIE